MDGDQLGAPRKSVVDAHNSVLMQCPCFCLFTLQRAFQDILLQSGSNLFVPLSQGGLGRALLLLEPL